MQLADLFKLSFVSAVFPVILKLAKEVPVFNPLMPGSNKKVTHT